MTFRKNLPRSLRVLPWTVLFLAAALVPPAVPVGASDPVAWIWSGAVTSRSAVVKTKVGREAEAVHLFVTPRAQPERQLQFPQTGYAAPDANGVVAFEVSDLTPETEYDYVVEVEGGGESPAGRFRTFSEGPMSFRIVFGSCARTASNHPIFSTMESLSPLFVLHMGDFHYENISRNIPSLYRRAFDEVLASERQSSLYRSAPIAYVWDDHDFGPNDSDGTYVGKRAALATYDQYVPHYPLERKDGKPEAIYQAFSVGRVRFLLTDVRSHREPDHLEDGPEKSMLGVEQREWLSRELEASRDRYGLIVWVNPVPWITEEGSGHGWGRYHWERQWIADRIRSLGLAHRLLMLSGDGHMFAIDDGTNSNFASDARPGERAFPVVHGAPFDRYPRPKGGPYSHGVYARRRFFGLLHVQQFGLMEVEDDGESLEVRLSGRDHRGDPLPGMALSVLCERGTCRPVPEEALAN